MPQDPGGRERVEDFMPATSFLLLSAWDVLLHACRKELF